MKKIFFQFFRSSKQVHISVAQIARKLAYLSHSEFRVPSVALVQALVALVESHLPENPFHGRK